MDSEKGADISHAPQVVEDDHPKEHTNYDLVDKEVAQYASDGLIDIDEATDKRLKRLIDIRILTVMVFTYFIQALDKGTMSFASIMGIIPDAHLVGQQVGAHSAVGSSSHGRS